MAEKKLGLTLKKETLLIKGNKYYNYKGNKDFNYKGNKHCL